MLALVLYLVRMLVQRLLTTCLSFHHDNMVSGDEVVLPSVLILVILFDLFLVGHISSVDSLVTSSFLAFPQFDSLV